MDKQEKKTIKYLSYKLKKFKLDLTDFSETISIQDDKDAEIYDMILDELQDISRCLDIMIDEEAKGQ
jgi:hypothetical protein